MPKWEYIGDVNLHYGGFFADLSDRKWGYANVVRVTDLDSGCGFDTAVLVEHVTVNGLDDEKRQDQALSCLGLGDDFKMPKKGTKAWYMLMIDAYLTYGYCDRDEDWDHRRSSYMEIIQQEKDGPMRFDGWVADVNLEGKSLKKYIRDNHLK